MGCLRFPLASGSRLPRIDELNPLGPDRAGDPRTGNVLLFVREVDPVVVCADTTSCPQRMIDVYHFVCCYPHDHQRHVITDDAHDARDLVHWCSIGYPSYEQIMAITDDAQRANAVRTLHNEHGYEIAWDLRSQAQEAFYRLDGAGSVSPSPIAMPVIEEHYSR